MAATQLRHAKLWLAGKKNNWDLAAYEIDEIAEGLEDAGKQFPTHEGIPVADMIKANIDPAVAELRKAVGAKSSSKFAVAFEPQSGRNWYLSHERPRSVIYGLRDQTGLINCCSGKSG
jgi:hypothetical protein